MTSGKFAEKRLKQWFLAQDFWFYRLPDQVGGFKGANNPCDFLSFTGEKLILIESKATENDKYYLSALAENQKSGLAECKKFNNMLGLVVVSFLYSTTTKIIDYNYCIEHNIKAVKRDKLETHEYLIPLKSERLYGQFKMPHLLEEKDNNFFKWLLG